MKFSQSQSRNSFVEGVRDSTPIIISWLFVYFAIGEASSTAGLDIFQGLALTLLVFAAPAQLIIIEFIAKHAWWTIPVATFIINFRFMFISAMLIPYFQSQSKNRILASLPVLNAGTFAVSFVKIKAGEPYPYEYFLGVCAITCFVTIIATIFGFVKGESLPTEVMQVVSMVLPIHLTMLVGKAWPKLRVIIAAILGFVFTPIINHYFANSGLMLAPLIVGVVMMLAGGNNE